MSNKVVAIFAEGPTEIEFYKAVVINARNKMGTSFPCKIEYKDMNGIGNYKKDALRKFNKMKTKYPNEKIYVFICIDNDVFELAKKPPIDKTILKKELLDAGAKEVHYVIANQSIEEWFLYDYEGVLSYLNLSKTTKRPKGNGQNSLKALFKKANKLYIKGSKTEGFIDKLNIEIVMKSCCDSLKPLCHCLGIDCKTLCNK